MFVCCYLCMCVWVRCLWPRTCMSLLARRACHKHGIAAPAPTLRRASLAPLLPVFVHGDVVRTTYGALPRSVAVRALGGAVLAQQPPFACRCAGFLPKATSAACPSSVCAADDLPTCACGARTALITSVFRTDVDATHFGNVGRCERAGRGLRLCCSAWMRTPWHSTHTARGGAEVGPRAGTSTTLARRTWKRSWCATRGSTRRGSPSWRCGVLARTRSSR